MTHPFELRVTSLEDAGNLVADGWPTHVLSLLDPLARPPKVAPNHMLLRFSDVPGSPEQPELGHAREILSFGRTVPGRGARVLVHCHMGLRRSPAAAAALLVQAGVEPKAAFRRIGDTKDWMDPHRELAVLLDRALKAEGSFLNGLNDWIADQPGATPGRLFWAKGRLG